MKTKHFLFTSALLMAVTLISCKKDKSDPNNNGGNSGNAEVNYTINGGSFHNQQVTFNSNPKTTNSGADGSQGYLLVYIDDAPSDDAAAPHALILSFDKAGIGTASVNKPIPNATGDNEGGVVAFGLELPSVHVAWSKVNPKDTPGTITITKFGAVGQPVEGTFEGTVVDAANVKYTISGGHFKIIRGA